MDWHHLASRWWLAPAGHGLGGSWRLALAGRGLSLRREDVESQGALVADATAEAVGVLSGHAPPSERIGQPRLATAGRRLIRSAWFKSISKSRPAFAGGC